MEQQKGIFKYILVVFASIIIIADVCLIFMHNKPFSENENRTLQQFPVANTSSIVSGKFMSEAEGFVSDQFFLRDKWISLKFLADKYTGRENSNGVWLGYDNYLFEDINIPRGKSLIKNLEAIKEFAKGLDVNMTMALVPNAAGICGNLHPFYTPLRNQSRDISFIEKNLAGSLSFVNLDELFRAHKNEDIFYRSDHHWTSAGAKYAFEYMASALNIEDVIKDYYVLLAADDFSGTMASKSGSFNTKDSIYIYIPKTENFEYVVEYVEEQQKSATIFNSAALDTKNKYEVFLGGNHPQISIKTTVNNGRNLLIFKDSYANAFMQFILPYFETITIIDPRYYSDDCTKMIEAKGITDVLFLYGANTFVEDNSLAGVLSDRTLNQSNNSFSLIQPFILPTE